MPDYLARPRLAESATSGANLQVREMKLAEVSVRIDYFHEASDEHLRALGVDRALLPTRQEWIDFYELDYSRPISERLNYTLVWELDDTIAGFSSADEIAFGEQAFMHLHILDQAYRRSGLGTQFVNQSEKTYFRTLRLQRLYCQPNALNVAPNRTLQRAGFRYVFTKTMAPSPINFSQPITRWVLDQPPT